MSEVVRTGGTHDRLCHGVNIVTASHEGKRAGLAVAWACQVSGDRILVVIGSQSHTRPMIEASGAFGVSVLKEGQQDLGRRFGRQQSDDVDKFEGLEVFAAETGAPLLRGCPAWFDCRVAESFEMGGTKLVVGEIVACGAEVSEFVPLIYRENEY
jgi:flavin reductase (DIM6/NTAB) family NADH-FMN oxidoreductase RutF